MINIDTVNYIAHLARIKLSDDERRRLLKDLSKIIDYVDKLKKVDTEKVEPTSHVLPISNVFREDEVLPSVPKEKILPSGDYFKVPRIIE